MQLFNFENVHMHCNFVQNITKKQNKNSIMKKQTASISYVLLILISIFGFSCTKDSLDKTVEPTGDTGKFTDLVIPEGFTWTTAKNLQIDLLFVDDKDQPVTTDFEIYSDYPDGVKYMDATTAEDGSFKSKYKVAAQHKYMTIVLPGEEVVIVDYTDIALPDIGIEEAFEAKQTIVCKQSAFKSTRSETYQYFPAEEQFGTICFEDQWPYQGDYDFNDVVLDYNVKATFEDCFYVTKIDMVLYLRASGAAHHNGLGISFKHCWSWMGMPNPDIGSVKVNGNNIPAESGTMYPSYILIQDIEEIQPTHNTFPDNPFDDPIRFEVSIEFDSPAMDWWDVDLPLNNMFIFVNQDRGREVHLPWKVPTALANPDYVGTASDASDPYAFDPSNFKSTNSVAGYYTYMTEEGYPWGLDIYFDEAGDNLFRYPVEFMDIREAYSPAFDGWVQYWSPWDWYKPEYRVEGKVYETIPDPVYPEMQ